jgi:hypothetical protein
MPLPILEAGRRGAMNRARVLWQFVRDDTVARSLGLAIVLVAWFAATWLSLGVASLLPFLGVGLWWRYRSVGPELVQDDLDDLL